jgi:protein tyrosine phosphatase (PTP) superfamily phosphohydrolase (DUF442 family)
MTPATHQAAGDVLAVARAVPAAAVEGVRRRLVTAWVVPLLVVALLCGGNLAILLASATVRAVTARPAAPPVAGIDNFRVVDERVWRGANPSPAGWRALAAQGVRTVVDLRAEADETDRALPTRLGMAVVAVPVGDGRAPSPAAVERALAAIEAAPGRVFVHCGAGVGRSGSMVAAYLVGSGQATAGEALLGSLAVGPPSLEQLAFMAGLDREGGVGRPAWPLVVLSRLLDSPRVLWARLA